MGTRREALAAEIRAERARQNIPFGVLAEKAGMSTDTLRRRLSGVRPFYFHELELIAAAFGLPLSELTGRTEDAA
jgi:transcriptional regulator with XRE-family HTH domain